jgi:large subunit ribosomal protein L30
MAEKVTITLVKSQIGKPEKHRLVLQGLGLTKLNKSVVLEDTAQVRGMINKVAHLVKVTD